MAWRVDPYDKSLVIDGFQDGIADDPFDGISDMRSVNITSVPGEASVNFSTSSILPTVSATFSVDTSDAAADTIHIVNSTGLEPGMAINFSASTVGGVGTATVYWLGVPAGNNYQIFAAYGGATPVDISSNGTGTFTVYNPQKPKYFAYANDSATYWMVDSIGQVWSNLNVTSTSSYWTYTGNKVPNSSNTDGNGLVYYQAKDGTGYLFIFHNSSVDATKTTQGGFGWNYQWNIGAGNFTGYAASPSTTLKTAVGSKKSHEALVGQDNVVYYCDSNFVGSFFEKPGQTFNPVTLATYTWSGGTSNGYALQLPVIDNANCLAELGTNLLVGGQRNLIYPWNRVDTSFTYPIFLSENVVSKMVTVNTNTFIFIGNRGRIYITNGSQAMLYKKVPDHISGTVEPYFNWGGVTFIKNQLFFGLTATTNAGVAIPQYGGVWAIDLDTKGLRMANKLSYGTYAGYATALISRNPPLLTLTNPAGTGLFIGWDNGASGYGVDATISTPYTGSQASIDSDLIPVGTFAKPRQFERIEYKLTKPMVAGESISIYYRLDFSQNYALIFTDNAVGSYSTSQLINFGNAQWAQFQIVLNSTASSPSYTRLKEIRLTGLKQ